MEYEKPWAVDPENSLNPAILNSQKELVCDVFFCELPEENQIQNLRLIACAPEMLEMLQNILKNRLGACKSISIQDLQELIKKATE